MLKCAGCVAIAVDTGAACYKAEDSYEKGVGSIVGGATTDELVVFSFPCGNGMDGRCRHRRNCFRGSVLRM